MLRIVQNSSSAGAKSYYSTADYYTQGQELDGVWRGKGAARLGLSGTIKKNAWEALCDNRNPETGKTLTARQKSERRVGYDINFHVPKSVSILYGVTGDERILDAFRHAVNETMEEMEGAMKTRVRRGGKNEDRTTGEMIWGDYVHFTSRPVDGVPDPHLHAHCFAFNTTFDAKENRWKAGQFADLKRDAPYFEAKFHSRMARNLAEIGVPIERSKKGWEVRGIARSAIEKFSRRTAVVKKTALELEAKAEAEWQEALAKGKDAKKKVVNKFELGASTRERKVKNLSMDDLRREWRSRLSDDERSGIVATVEQIGIAPIAENSHAAENAGRYAVSHCFERKSVVPERVLLAEAIKRCIGEATAETAERAVLDQGIIVGEKDGRRLATTRAVLSEEQRMIDFAKSGRGACEKLGDGSHVFRRERLNDGQRKAVEHVLDSRDRVILIRGVAGTGKTTMMTEAVEAIGARGKRVFTFAPSADASRGVLRQEGFKDAETVAMLLKDDKLQEKIRGQVIWIDEASLLGSRTMGQVFHLAEELGARVILSGDRRQHGSVERGAALRLLETEAGVVPAEIKAIQRQTGAYKQAVAALSEGRTEQGFKQLDQLGWIEEVPDGERYKQLAGDYIAAINAGKTALVVSPTHREGDRVTEEIREQLRQERKLGKEQQQLGILRNANLTSAERTDAVNYNAGDVLIFHQNAKGFRKGERLEVGSGALPVDHADRFAVFHPGMLSLSPGDKIRITRNGKTADGEHRLNNGAIYVVKNFTKQGDIRLTNGWTIDKKFGHLAHGYVVTSQASQGKTVDRVFVGISSASFPASSREGFYVAASRGREMVRVYTDDKEALLGAVCHTDDRLSATEFVNEHRERGKTIRRMERHKQAARELAEPSREREGLVYDR